MTTSTIAFDGLPVTLNLSLKIRLSVKYDRLVGLLVVDFAVNSSIPFRLTYLLVQSHFQFYGL
jgi:hypothetical protein